MNKIATPEASPAVSESIHDNYNKCFEYVEVFKAINGISSEHGSFEQAKAASLELLARLRVWGDESKAEFPAVSRDSLDDILRNEVKMKRTVRRILGRLQKNLAICVQFKEASNTTEATEDSESDSISSKESDSGGSAKLPTVSAVIRQMKQDIGSLLQVSLLIRQPGYERRYIHSTDPSQSSSTFAKFADLDLSHVAEKLRSWRPDRKVVHEQEAAATAISIKERKSLDDFSEDHVTLIRRLAKANTRRREQLLYWVRHPDQSYQGIDRVQADTPAPAPRKEDPTRDTLTQQDSTVTYSPVLKDGLRGPSESVKTRDTFSIRIESEAQGTSNAGSSIPVQYQKSVLGMGRTNQVPKMPEVAPHALSFECLYCRGVISLQRMKRREEWKRHVLKDLRAYVCTYPDCQNPDKQYSTQEDWFNHEKQVHRRQWFCGIHGDAFDSPELLVQHINQLHAAAIPQEQMANFVALSERSTDQNIDTPCPLCPEIRPLTELEGHLAEHLESIALFVVGAENDDNVDGDTSESQSTAGSRTSLWLLSNPSDFISGSQDVPSVIQSVNSDSERASSMLSTRSLSENDSESSQLLFDPNSQRRTEIESGPLSTETTVQAVVAGTPTDEKAQEASITTKLFPTAGDIVIAVIGSSGAGKTTFINYFSDQVLSVNTGLEKSTTRVESHACTLSDGTKLFLVEFSAMEGTIGLDAEFLKMVSWLCTTCEQGIQLSGVIYLHDIGQNRIMGSQVRFLRMLDKLVGEENAGAIVLATTFWQEITLDLSLSREERLRTVLWQKLVKAGSKVKRQDRGRDSASEILQYLMNRRVRPFLTLQREMVEEGLSLNETGVGKQLQAELDSEKAIYKRRLETLEEIKEELSSITEGSRSEDIKRPNMMIAQEEEALENNSRDIGRASRQLQVKWDSLKRGMLYPNKDEREENDDDDERDMGMQDINDEISDNSYERSDYQSVALLVLRWENSVHKTGEDEEVARLKSVLGDRFNFDVSAEILLGGGIEELERSQETINRAIINHIDLFDSPKTLLIIYYTGDAILQTIDGKKELMLSTVTDVRQTSIGESIAYASCRWSTAERPLIQDTDGDVLTILDCCYAGDAHDVTTQAMRSYELLGACERGGQARANGPDSFTARLLDTLERLLETPGTPRSIGMTHLVELLNSPGKDGQSSVVLFDRLRHYRSRCIQLVPMRQRSEQKMNQSPKMWMTVSERRQLRALQRWKTALDYASELSRSKSTSDSRLRARQLWRDVAASGKRKMNDHRLPTHEKEDDNNQKELSQLESTSEPRKQNE